MALSCASHPAIETGLSCGKCGTPICGSCVVATLVGTRCRDCAPQMGGRRAQRSASGDSTLVGVPVPAWVRLAVFFAALVAAPLAVGYAWAQGDRDLFIVRSIVYGGWIASLVLHEFAHSLVAYIGGDRQIRQRGYLTLNPLRFMDPVFSVAIPILIVLVGGIPLIGGATRIDHRALRSRWWEVWSSLAGPAANIACAAGISAFLRFGPVDAYSNVGLGLSFLALLQVSAALFNLIPLPPLDGFHALGPFLPPEVEERAWMFGRGGIFLIFMLFRLSPAVSDAFWRQVWQCSDALGIPDLPAYIGSLLARL